MKFLNCSSSIHSNSIIVQGMGGHSNGKRGYQARPWTHKKHPITYFSGMKIDPKCAFLHAFFLNLSVMSFPKFVYMTKNTFFSNFACFCTPKRCTHVQCLVLKNNPNYVNFWTSLIFPLTFECPPPGDLNFILW